MNIARTESGVPGSVLPWMCALSLWLCPQAVWGTDPPTVVPEREAAVRAFVEAHHPELLGLLRNLKQRNHPLYVKAIRELHRDSERLANMYERDPRRHSLELRVWQADSRVQLLSARLQVSDNPGLRRQLRAQLEERYEARLALLRAVRDQQAARLVRSEEQIERLESQREEQIERQLRMVLREAQRGLEAGNDSAPSR